jgi:hypothetical protein
MGRRKINLSIVFAGQNVGVKQVSDKVWLVSFMKYNLGFFDEEAGRVTSVENPFDAKVSHVSGKKWVPSAQVGPNKCGSGGAMWAVPTLAQSVRVK